MIQVIAETIVAIGVAALIIIGTYVLLDDIRFSAPLYVIEFGLCLNTGNSLWDEFRWKMERRK